MKQVTNLLPVFSIQVNMLSAVIKPDYSEVLVLLTSGKVLKITGEKRTVKDAHDILHFSPVFDKNRNNSFQLDSEITLEVI